MRVEQGITPRIVGLNCPIYDLVVLENLFRENLPLPTDESDLVRVKRALCCFTSLVRKANAGETKTKKLKETHRNIGNAVFSPTKEEKKAMEVMHLLIPIEDITLRLISLEFGLEEYLGGHPVKEEDRLLISNTISILETMAMSGLITTSPEPPSASLLSQNFFKKKFPPR